MFTVRAEMQFGIVILINVGKDESNDCGYRIGCMFFRILSYLHIVIYKVHVQEFKTDFYVQKIQLGVISLAS